MLGADVLRALRDARPQRHFGKPARSTNRRDVAHIVALQGQGQSAGIRLQHVRGGDDPLLWIPDAVLGALNSVHLGEEQYWEKLHEKVVLNRPTPDSL